MVSKSDFGTWVDLGPKLLVEAQAQGTYKEGLVEQGLVEGCSKILIFLSKRSRLSFMESYSRIGPSI